MAPIRLRRRLDHGPMYMCVTLGLFAGAIYILSHWFTPTPLFSWLTLGTENTMAVTQLVGCAGAIFGMCCGTRFLFQGMDLRDIYNIGKWSLIPVIISFGTFVIGTVATGWVEPWYGETMLLFYGVELGLILVAVELHYESLRLSKALARRIEAIADESDESS